MKLERISTPKHGIYFHQEPGPRGLGWWQYYKAVDHVWYWHGIPVWWVMRRRDRPMHEFLRKIFA